MTAIESIGVHVPRYRISAEEIKVGMGQFSAGGVTEKAVAGPDEDTLTMGVEAAEQALDASEIGREEITAMAVGTTTPPLEENALAAQFVEMLALPRSVETTTNTQSTAAGTEALRVAMHLRNGPALVIASDVPSGNPDTALGHGAGAGAIALVLADEGAAEITAVGSYAQEFPGTRYRVRGDEHVQAYGATGYERHAYATTIAGALENVTGEPSALAPTAPNGSIPYRSANEIESNPTIYERATSLGDTGAASPFFGLLEAWDNDESVVYVVGYGDGATANAVVVEGTVPVDATGETVHLDYPEYLRYRGTVVSNGGRK